MAQYPEGTPSGASGAAAPANVSFNTMGGLHMLAGSQRFGANVIIPLSAQNFVVVSVSGAVATESSDSQALAKTIVALDPKVATPISQAEQTQIIQAEASAYSSVSSNVTPTPVISVMYKTSFDDGTLHTTLFRSNNAGNTWKNVLDAYKSSIVYATDSTNPNIIYAGDTSCNGMADTSRGCAYVFRSTDGGDNWTTISGGIMNQIGVIYGVSAITLDQNNSNNVTVTVSDQTNTITVFQSTDGGNTWNKLSS